MHPAVYIIGFIVFALIFWWIARGARGSFEEGDKDASEVRWFPDGGGGPTPGPQ
jgi:hypothetical protein